ncbi:MAG: glycosyltransferase family 4 protein [Anaerolineae bacterium]|nr:glycosyltransferase family 4 protein [Anaerolineae bacterium]
MARRGLSPLAGSTRLLIISHDVVDRAMAGPGIRYWELARVLARTCHVTLAVPWRSQLEGDWFQIVPYEPGDWASVRALAARMDVVMPCGFVLGQFPGLVDLACAIVVDGYAPYPAEAVGLMVDRPAHEQDRYHVDLANRLRIECLGGDLFLCASERQRHWWLGLLTAYGRLNVDTYAADPTLRSLVAVVPSGCRPETPAHTRDVLKGVWAGIGRDDRVVLWGGGIWEWLDPVTLLHAVRQLVPRRPDLRLVFPGTHHPNPIVGDMPRRRRAVELAGELGLLGKHVFFGDLEASAAWVPYADWQNYLLEADVGVSLHVDSLEADLAFRSRVMDYIGAGLPMVVTAGDATSEIVERFGLGMTVGARDVAGVAQAIDTLLDEPRMARRAEFDRARAALSWAQVARPLVDFCQAPRRAPDHARCQAALRP